MKIWFLVGSGVCLFLALMLTMIGIILIVMARKKGVPPAMVEGSPMAPPLPVGNPDYVQPASYTTNPDYAQPAYTPPAYSPPAYTPPAYTPPAYTPAPIAATTLQPLPEMVSDNQQPADPGMGMTEVLPLAQPERTADPERTVMSTEPVFVYGKLICTSGALLGQRFELGSAGLVIGRERTIAQVVVQDPRVSKKHVWVGDRGGEVVAVDQGSTNGTFLNKPDSPRITEAVLQPGDVLIISDDVARFEYDR